MRFTKWIVSGFEDDAIIHAFYDGDVFCSSYHAHDLSIEWEQFAFLLSKCAKMDNFEYLDWSGAKEVVVVGLNHDECVDIQCKLCNYQFTQKVNINRQLEVIENA